MQAVGQGFEPLILHHACVAQSVEHFVGNEEVTGSSPVAGSIGRVPEWLKGTGCKPVSSAYVGSNPTASTSLFYTASPLFVEVRALCDKGTIALVGPHECS